jgi:ABC transporter DrrB family efflux protein
MTSVLETRSTGGRPAPAVMVEVAGISKRFGSTQALDKVDMEVEANQVVALLGPNGSGKTTLVRVLTTLLMPDAGRASVAGCDVVRDATRLRSMIGLAGQYATVDELLTGRENLELVGLLYHLPRAEYRRRADEALQRLDLAESGDKPVKSYSGGMRRRLDLGASLMGRPPVLFLDEPTTGLDPRTRNNLWGFIEDLVAEGTTVLLTTQYMEEAERLAKRIVVIDHGRVVAQGTADQLKEQMGGNVLEVRTNDSDELQRAASLIADLGTGPPRVDPELNVVSLPTTGGAACLIEAGRRLVDNQVGVADLGIRRPSLDDVFLALTGHETAVTPAPTGAEHRTESASRITEPGISPRPNASAPLTPSLAIRDGWGITRRNLVRLARTPQLLFMAIVQPSILLLLFRYVLGGAIKIPGVDYVNYIVPGIFIEAVLIGGMTTALSLAEDVKSGMVDRFRSLPMARAAFLAGRTFADICRSVLALGFMVLLGLLVGFRFHNSWVACLAGMALIVVFGYVFTWAYATIGLAVKDPETAQMAAILPFFVLLFASSALVPVSTMPSWLQPFARNQPASVVISCARALLEGGPVFHLLWQAAVWCFAIFVAFFMTSLRLYRRLAT